MFATSVVPGPYVGVDVKNALRLELLVTICLSLVVLQLASYETIRLILLWSWFPCLVPRRQSGQTSVKSALKTWR